MVLNLNWREGRGTGRAAVAGQTQEDNQHNRTAACWPSQVLERHLLSAEGPPQSEGLGLPTTPCAWAALSGHHFVDSFPTVGICKAAATLMSLPNNVWVSRRRRKWERDKQKRGERLTHLLRTSFGRCTKIPPSANQGQAVDRTS